MTPKEFMVVLQIHGKHPGADRLIHKLFKSEKWRQRAWVFLARIRKHWPWFNEKMKGPLIWEGIERQRRI